MMGADPAAQKPAALAAPVAQKPAAPAEQKPAAPEVKAPSEKAEEMRRNSDAEKYLNRIAKGEEMIRAQNYIPALKLFNEVRADLEKEKKEKADKSGEKYLPLYLVMVQTRLDESFVPLREKCGEMRYQEARKLYKDALFMDDSLVRAEKAALAKQKAQESNALYYLGFGPDVGSRKAFPEELNAAIGSNKDFAAQVESLVAECEKIMGAVKLHGQGNLAAVDPIYDNTQNDINVLYAKAEKLYRDQQYTKSRDLLEKILVVDMFNQKAIRLLDKIYQKLYFYGELRQYNEMLRTDGELIWTWTPSIPGERPPKPTKAQGRDLSESPLSQKLQDWDISVDFDELDVVSALALIGDKIKERDQLEGRGVNFIRKINPQTQTKKISLHLNNTPADVVLRYLTQMTGMRYKIDNDMVVIGNNIDNFETRFIPVRSAIIEKIREKKGDDSSADLPRKDGKKDGASVYGPSGIGKSLTKTEKEARITSDALKKFFAERGASFDAPGTTIAYDRGASKLTVCHTPEKLREIEHLIRELDIENPLVMIESKILEMQLNDAEELGFDWVLTHNNDENPNWNFSMSSPLRDSSAVGLIDNKMINNLNILPNFTLGNGSSFSLYVTMTAVDRTDRVEVLSTPKVVTISGQEATIQMVRQMYFPESWEDPDTSNVNGTSFEFQPSYPSFGDPTDIGITFIVTPTVNSNGKTITLALNPKVTDQTGWSDYSYTVKMGDVESDITLKMAEISNREVNSNVKVFDGQTLLIGGMMTEKQSTMDDRFPILGQIPIVGRLFSKYASNDNRTNLLISVTTRLISGDGVPIESSPTNGLPDFRR